MNAYELREFLRVAGTLLWAVLLTMAVELPIISLGKLTKNIKLIIALNVATNVTFNCICQVIYHLGQSQVSLGTLARTMVIGWIALSELFWIPLTEAWVYGRVSKASKKKIYIVTYLANFASFFVGLLLQWFYAGNPF